VVDHPYDQQRETHLTSAEYRGAHGTYDRSANDQFAEANQLRRVKTLLKSSTAVIRLRNKVEYTSLPAFLM